MPGVRFPASEILSLTDDFLISSIFLFTFCVFVELVKNLSLGSQQRISLIPILFLKFFLLFAPRLVERRFAKWRKRGYLPLLHRYEYTNIMYLKSSNHRCIR
ncbi:hypothetical protein BX600DRAFT_291564 [Xylariales sp. PMI_506]|nr:hypothetical protein BX600DRAFT_291564 [Xylariales sp. PMI_506]